MNESEVIKAALAQGHPHSLLSHGFGRTGSNSQIAPPRPDGEPYPVYHPTYPNGLMNTPVMQDSQGHTEQPRQQQIPKINLQPKAQAASVAQPQKQGLVAPVVNPQQGPPMINGYAIRPAIDQLGVPIQGMVQIGPHAYANIAQAPQVNMQQNPILPGDPDQTPKKKSWEEDDNEDG